MVRNGEHVPLLCIVASVCFREICNVLANLFFSSLILFFSIRRTFRRRKKSWLPPPPSHFRLPPRFLGLGLGSRSSPTPCPSVLFRKCLGAVSVSGFRTLFFPLLIISNEKGNVAPQPSLLICGIPSAFKRPPLRFKVVQCYKKESSSNLRAVFPLDTEATITMSISGFL